MDMRRITGKQHSASAIGIDKPRSVRPSAAVFERFNTDVRAADTAEHGFIALVSGLIWARSRAVGSGLAQRAYL